MHKKVEILLPANWNPPADYAVRMENCANYLHDHPKSVKNQIIEDINRVGYDGDLTRLVHQMNSQEIQVLCTAALSALYTDVQLHK